MVTIRDNLRLSLHAIRAHKLRASLAIVGLTIGVATLITVMTVIQGANVFVERNIANLGTNVFRVARVPFTPTSLDEVLRALRNAHIDRDDLRAIAESCPHCESVGATSAMTARVRSRHQEVQDTTVIGHTASMADIDTRKVRQGRYFTEIEDLRSAPVCLIGARLASELYAGADPIGKSIRANNEQFIVIGTYEQIGAVLGQDQDNFLVIPMRVYEKFRGGRFSLTLEVKAAGGDLGFERAQDEVRAALRARRHIIAGREEDFFIGTASSYISLWDSISSAFFAVFVLVSSVASVISGVVIMNVMLVSVVERTNEIGVRRAVGATQWDVLNQFLAESVIQCIAGGSIGVLGGFLCALALQRFTEFPANVETWVAFVGLTVSSLVGLVFGIYPALRAARLDPMSALRTE